MPRVAAAAKTESPEVTELKAKLAAAEAENSRLRSVAPVTRNPSAVEATNLQVGQPGTVTMPSTGAPRLEHPDVQVADGPVSQGKIEMLAFMDEKVVVEVLTSDDKYAEPVVPIWNDGRIQCFPRGVQVTCKRKFLEVLGRARPVRFANEEYVDPQGNKAFRYPKTTSLKYPFVVHQDTAAGRAWLKKILAEA